MLVEVVHEGRSSGASTGRVGRAVLTLFVDVAGGKVKVGFAKVGNAADTVVVKIT